MTEKEEKKLELADKVIDLLCYHLIVWKNWKAEYERLRRNRNREIDRLHIQIAEFTKKTWDLLIMLGMSEKEILEYYDRRV